MTSIRRTVIPCLYLIAFTIFVAVLVITIPHSFQLHNEQIHSSSNDKRAEPIPPPISHVLETCLYVRNMNVSVRFYKDILRLNNYMVSPRLSGFSLGTTTLLLFHLGETSKDLNYQGLQGSPGKGQIAGHGPDQSIVNSLGLQNQTNSANFPAGHPEVSLKLHFALAVEKREDVFKWEEYFRQTEVHIHSTMEWERGGRSVYFFDPDGHVGEIVSRGIWPHW